LLIKYVILQILVKNIEVNIILLYYVKINFFYENLIIIGWYKLKYSKNEKLIVIWYE